MISLLLKLLIAHSIGDFVLQPSHWVKSKQKKKHSSKYLYFHVIIHALLLALLLKFDWSYWLLILVITLSHFIIDLVKLNIDKGKFSGLLFALDQVAHLLVIMFAVHIYEPYQIDFHLIYSQQSLLIIFALLSTTYISSIIMKIIMSQWTIEGNDKSLQNAGKYIGVLERLFVFGFIVLNQWQAIGLLITAKSVFRFGDLSKAKDRKLTEYVLIGTLLSFGLAIVIGLLYKFVLNNLLSL